VSQEGLWTEVRGGWLGVPVAQVLAVGVKVAWSAQELEAAERTRDRPVKWYENHQEAQQRFLRVAGIPVEAASDPTLLAVEQEATRR
jgi:hypothetical protein